MFKTILVPVDLAHKDKLTKALDVAADQAENDQSEVILVGVTGSAPTSSAHNPAEYAEKLAAFAKEFHDTRGVKARPLPVVDHDVAADLNNRLVSIAKAEGADLIVMASHTPGMLDHIFTSHAGHVASHADISVFVVR